MALAVVTDRHEFELSLSRDQQRRDLVDHISLESSTTPH